ncbi:MAG: alpha/beta hydrolase [Acidimicrobiales bacterium]
MKLLRFATKGWLVVSIVLVVGCSGGGPSVSTPTLTAGDTSSTASDTSSLDQAVIDDRMIDVGGHTLHVVCQGTGSPTVLVEMGAGQSVSTWSAIQPTLADSYRTCVYERAGSGVSEPGPLPRTAQRVADELQTVIDRAPIPTPLVLLSHSLGAMYAQLFAAQHPTEVAGMVFIEPRTAEFQLGYRDHLTPEELKADEIDLAAARLENFWPEIEASDESAAQVKQAGPLPAVPVIVLTAGGVPGQSEADSFWRTTHSNLAAQVPNGRQQIIDDADHELFRTHQQTVLDAVASVAAQR